MSLRILSTFFLILVAVKAQADLKTEAYVYLEPSKVDELITEFLPPEFEVNDIEFELENFDDLEGMDFQRPSLSLLMSPMIRSTKNGTLVGHLLIQKAQLKLRDFKYREVRYIDQGTIKARVNVNVDCSELTLGFTNSVAFLETSPVVYKGQVKFPKRNRGFTLEPNELDVDLSQCQSPRNIENLFVEALEEWITSDDAQKFIEEKAFSAVEGYLNELLADLLSNQVLLGNEFSFAVKSLDFVEGNWRIGVALDVKNEEVMEIKFSGIPSKDSSATNQIKIPKAVLSLMLPKVVDSLNLPLTVDRSQIPGVDRLFNSRLIQFFVWSDLSNFKKDVNFNLDIFFFNNKLRYITEQNGQIYFRLKNNHWMDMNFLGGETRYPYMQLLGETEAQIGLRFEADVVKIQFLDVGADTNVNWHPEMTNWRQSEARSLPKMSMILPSVLSGLEGFELDFNIKDLIGDFEIIKDLDLSSSEESVNVDFN